MRSSSLHGGAALVADIALCVYFISFLLPIADSGIGLALFVMGFLGMCSLLSPIWIANPLFCVAIAKSRAGKGESAFVLGLLAFLFSTLPLPAGMSFFDVGIAYPVWVTGMLLVTVAGVMQWIHQSRRLKNPNVPDRLRAATENGPCERRD